MENAIGAQLGQFFRKAARPVILIMFAAVICQQISEGLAPNVILLAFLGEWFIEKPVLKAVGRDA